jgi:hypothetical protein
LIGHLGCVTWLKRTVSTAVARPVVWGVYVKRNREGQNGNIHMAESERREEGTRKMSCVREILL